MQSNDFKMPLANFETVSWVHIQKMVLRLVL